MKNFKSFLLGIICCLGIFALQSNVSNVNNSNVNNSNDVTWNEQEFLVSLKYLHRDKTNQFYTLIITETKPFGVGRSVHTQLEPGILKPYK